MSTVKAISFDADGTLIGSFAGSSRGFEHFFLHAAHSRGKKLSLEELDPILKYAKEETAKWRATGFQPYASEENSRRYWLWFYEEVFSEMDLPDPKDMAHEFLLRYESGEFTTAYPDVLPCLETLSARRIPMIVISNYAPLLERFLEKLNLSKYFKAALVSGITGIEKPDPAMYELGAETFGLPPHEILHVGNDVAEDYDAAQKAGFQAVLLDRDDTCRLSHIRRIQSLGELPASLPKPLGTHPTFS